MDVAELGDAQALELLRQPAKRQIDLMNVIIVPTNEKSVGACAKRDRSGERTGSLKKSTAIEANVILRSVRAWQSAWSIARAVKPKSSSPNDQTGDPNQADAHPGEECCSNPQADHADRSGKPPDQVPSAPKKRGQQGCDYKPDPDRHQSPQSAAKNSQWNAGGESPEALKPIGLRP